MDDGVWMGQQIDGARVGDRQRGESQRLAGASSFAQLDNTASRRAPARSKYESYKAYLDVCRAPRAGLAVSVLSPLRSLAPSPPDHAFARVCFGAGALDPRALLLWWPSRLDGRLRRLERGEHRLPRLLARDQHAQEDRDDEQDHAEDDADDDPRHRRVRKRLRRRGRLVLRGVSSSSPPPSSWSPPPRRPPPPVPPAPGTCRRGSRSVSGRSYSM